MTSVGFTGTRAGMSIDQMGVFFDLIRAEAMTEFHCGDAIGADDQAARLVHGHKLITGQAIVLHCHPCNIRNQRAWAVDYDVTHEVKPPLTRNRDIVDCSEVVYAAPKEYVEQMRGSGTWATMRCAVRQEKKLIVVWPDGKYEEDYVPDSMR